MANFYSDQVANFENSSPRVMVKPHELRGRVRIARWSYTTPAASAPAVGDYIALTKLPAQAVVINVRAVWEAMSSGAGTAGADYGVADDKNGTNFAADFTSALNMDAAGFKSFDSVIDKLPSVTPYTAERWVCAKVTGEAFATTKKFQGFVEYVVD